VTDKHPKIKTSSAVFFIQAKIAKKRWQAKSYFEFISISFSSKD
jgi:hypothetical protein